MSESRFRPFATRRAARATVALVALALAATGAVPASASGDQRPALKSPEATGWGGAVASVDADATAIGLDVLRRGGNAADAAVATGAALGVTEPYSAGIGGGGFLVYYDARSRRVSTIDGRETAPASFTETAFINLANGTPLPFNDVVRSGLSVGVPGTPALWADATRRFGTRSLGALLKPAEQLARHGFVVDATYAAQTAANAERFRLFPETQRVYLPGNAVPAVGSVVRNPDMAHAYRVLRREGVGALYRGDMGRAIVDTARDPQTAPGVSVFPGQITTADLRAYELNHPAPTRAQYRGFDVYGMPVPSSGGIAVGEALNLLEAYDERTGTDLGDVPQDEYLHRFMEASATAFADRNRYVGSVPGVPTGELLRQAYADERACGFSSAAAQPRPMPPGTPDGDYVDCPPAATGQPAPRDDHGTTHLTVTDRWGNVAAYTLTIEQTGGSGITVPGYGFLLNNELTDFNFAPTQGGAPDPNLPGPGKRPRSSMSPTIVMDDGRPWMALGSPGGATIITTVLQVLTGHVDRDLELVEAIAAPRVSSRNSATSEAEPAVFDGPLGADLRSRGHGLTVNPELGAATAIRILPHGRFEAAAETTRRGGGAAGVVFPARP